MVYEEMSVALRTGTSMYSILFCQGVEGPCTGNGNCTAGSFGAAVKDARRDSRVRLARRGDLHRRRWCYELASAGLVSPPRVARADPLGKPPTRRELPQRGSWT